MASVGHVSPDPTQIYLEIDMEMNALALEARLSSNSKTTTLQTSEEPTQFLRTL